MKTGQKLGYTSIRLRGMPPEPFFHGFRSGTQLWFEQQRMLGDEGHAVSDARIRRVIKNEGFRQGQAKVVLTSTDSNYTKKIEAIKKRFPAPKSHAPNWVASSVR